MSKTSSKHKKNKKELNPFYTYLKETERKRRKEYERFLEHGSESLGIPMDVIAGQPLIRMEGNHSMILLGMYKIGEYTQNQIILQVKQRNVVVYGESLQIQYFRKEEIKLTGNILNISFCRQGKA